MRGAALVLMLTAPAAFADQAPLARVTLDLIADRAGSEVAELTLTPGNDSAADLTIRAADGAVLAQIAEMTTAGSFAGAEPRLEVAENGTSLRVYQEWTGIGRNPWESVTTIAARDGEVIVAGFTQNMWDRITNETLACDWNLLSGDYVVKACALDDPGRDQPGTCHQQEKTGRNAQRITLEDWAAAQDLALTDFCTLR